MAEREGFYWDFRECEWVRCDSLPAVEIPQQQTAVSEEQEADVRSG